MRSITRSILLAALLVVLVQRAHAGVPSLGNSTIPSHVNLVGLGPAGPDSAFGQVTCTIRDLANGPVPGMVVTFDFLYSFDLAIASDQRDPRLFVNCDARTVSAVTDLNGKARFTLIGTGTQSPAHSPQSIEVFANGEFLGSVGVAVFERDGLGGLTLADMSYWVQDYYTGSYIERADLDGSGQVNLLDFSVWAAAYFNGNNVFAAGPYCP